MAETELVETLQYDEHSAEFWSQHLGRWAAQQQNKADGYAIAAAVLSALTGGAIWTTVSDSTSIVAQLAVTAMAMTVAVVALVPTLRGYGDCAMKAARLAGDYGTHLVSLRVAHDHLHLARPGAEDDAVAAIAAFQTTRAAKELLRPYPAGLEQQIQEERARLGITAPTWERV